MKKSEFVSSFDIAASLFKRITNAVIDAGGSDEHLRLVETDDGLCRQLGQLIVKAGKAVTAVFHVVVDYGLSLDQMREVGEYDWVNPDITAENFPITGEGKVKTDVVLVHLDKVASTKAVEAELDQRGLRPARIEELLAFGAKHPDEQRKYPIVGLGSVGVDRHGHRCVACLYEDSRVRRLNLAGVEGDWPPLYRFLAVRKS